jgi:hypothetical protein
MSSLADVLSAAAAAVGVIAASAQLALTRKQSNDARTEVERLTERDATAALQSNDIEKFGRYLYDNIGPTRVSNYAGNAQIRGRVTQALDSVLDFLGPEEPGVTADETQVVEQEAQLPDVREAIQRSEPEVIRETSEMATALNEITFGEVWNGLARMRRYIERTLLELYDGDPPPERRRTAGRMVNELGRMGRIPESSLGQLSYAIKVANAGIHGEEVEVGQAQEAWEAAIRGLALISQR